MTWTSIISRAFAGWRRPVINTGPARAVLFDLDGTLADTLPDLSHALSEAMIEHNIAPVEAAVLRPFVSRGARAMAAQACGAETDATTLEQIVTRFLALYGAGVSRHTRLFDGMPALLDELGHVASQVFEAGHPVSLQLTVGKKHFHPLRAGAWPWRFWARAYATPLRRSAPRTG